MAALPAHGLGPAAARQLQQFMAALPPVGAYAGVPAPASAPAPGVYPGYGQARPRPRDQQRSRGRANLPPAVLPGMEAGRACASTACMC
jgi:hypothetical protein